MSDKIRKYYFILLMLGGVASVATYSAVPEAHLAGHHWYGEIFSVLICFAL